MSGLGCEPLQKAIYDALTADSALMALVTGLYDRVPEGTAMPYVLFSQATAKDASNATDPAEEIRLELRVYSRSGGRKQALDVLERIHTVLHFQAPALSGGGWIVWMRVEHARVEMLRDGMTWQGTAAVVALVEGI